MRFPSSGGPRLAASLLRPERTLLLLAGVQRHGVPALCAPRHAHGAPRVQREVQPGDPPVQKKRHTLLTFGFTGTAYHGLQTQRADGEPGLLTVSDAMRTALLDTGFIAPSNWSPLQRTKWTLASRTDKGVHAACAAASVKLETHAEDVEDADRRDDWPADRKDWQLTPSALARINAALPADVRAFSGQHVRKSFSAHESASSRTYEYLLPVSALGGGADAVETLDGVLRGFEGTHRMHNFASGLRRGARNELQQYTTAGGDSWPLTFALDERTPAAYRSVLTSRVHKRLSVGGEDYVVLRIAGLAFVLHQIRHMVGAAVAVANGVVPADAVVIARTSTLEVDVAPLVPGGGLLLDEVHFFDTKGGTYEAQLPAAARREMEAFKAEVLYPHIHAAYAAGAWDEFLRELRARNFTKQYDDAAFRRLRRVGAALREAIAERRAASEARQAAFYAQKEADDTRARAEADAAADAAEAAGEPEVPPRPKCKPEWVTDSRLLPGGTLVALCVEKQLHPGPETHGAIKHLKARVKRGELESGQPYRYYLDALDDE